MAEILSASAPPRPVNDFLTVSTFLWDDPVRDAKRSYKFGPQHVITLRNMVKRNLTIPHEFVCVTDATARDIIATPLREAGIRLVPMDMSKHVPGTVFARLMLRHPNIASLLGRRILNLDLDCVITGNIDAIAGRPEASVFWRNPNFPAPGRAFYQTSIQLFDAGMHSELWNDFDPMWTPSWVNRRFGGAEQAWVSERLPWDLPYFDESHGVYGAGRLGGAGVYTELPANARIVFTPGQREPSQAATQEKHPWIAEFYK